MRNRTADLYNAIVALYQLSYDPEFRACRGGNRPRREPETNQATGGAQGKNVAPGPAGQAGRQCRPDMAQAACRTTSA